MKRNTLLALIALMGCGTPKYLDMGRPFVSRESAYDSVAVVEGRVFNRDGIYYVVPGSELSRVFTSRYLTYLGTEKGFHLMRLWSKVPQNESEVRLFALKVDSCNVEEARGMAAEFQKNNSSYRRVEFLPGCIVRKSK